MALTEAPAVARLLALVADGSLAVHYAPAIWHHPMTVLDRSGEYLVLRWDDGSAADTEWHQLEEPVLIDVPAPAGHEAEDPGDGR